MNHITLPADDAVLPDQPVQWWYWTGHLTAGPRRFGFEACFFAFNAETLLGQALRNHLQGHDLFDRLTDDLLSHEGFQMVNIALTDLVTNTYDGHTLFALGMPPVLPDAYALQLSFPPGRRAAASGGGGEDDVELDAGTWSLSLQLSNDDVTSPPAIHYGGRRHDYSFGGYTYYYSRPNQSARGRLVIGAETIDVTGHAWFDRQFGDLNAAVHQGWQWFAIQLRDNTQIMLFDLTGSPVETYGAIVDGSRYTHLGPGDFTVDVVRDWTSPVTQIRYPSLWRVSVGSRQMIVVPAIADQELREMHPFPTYWEGDCLVNDEAGVEIGQAYVELQGFTQVIP